MSQPTLIAQLIDALRCLPGVGPKSAQRMAFHLIERDQDGARRLAQALTEAMERLRPCARCRNYTDREVCSVCANARRDASSLCVVENPADMAAVEQAGQYHGLYFILMGHLSPLDGIGPEQLGLDLLKARLADGTVKELIIATNPTVEGEATAHFIHEMAHGLGTRTTRIAHGVPLGGELEYIDSGTLAHAFRGRREM